MPFIVLLYALFASVFVLGKYILVYAAPLFAVGSRMAVAGGILLLYLFFFNRKALKFSRQDWKSLILLAVFNIFLTNCLEFWGLQYLDAAKTSFLYSFTPFISAILSYFVFAERITMIKWIGLSIGFLGFMPILLHNSPYEKDLGHLFFLSWAELALIGATLATALGWILLRKLVQSEISPLAANGVSMLIGGVCSLGASFAFETWDPIPLHGNMGEALLFMALTTLVSNFLCYNLYGWLLKKYTASFLSFCGFMTPLFTAALGFVFLQETLTWHFFLSTAIVLSGLTLFYKEDLRLGYVNRTT